jgi:hypothetical protein
MHVWDTASVASGHYWLFSRAREVPESLPYAPLITFSTGIVSVQHAGDELLPAVVISRPSTLSSFADSSYVLEYRSLDPDRSARVTLEAAAREDALSYLTIAAELPALEVGSFEWNTRGLPEGDWIIRATIRDARGRSFVSYAQYYF